MDNAFPLKSNFFRSAPISPEICDEYISLAKEESHKLAQLAYGDRWMYIPPDRNGCKYCKDTSNMEVSRRLVRVAMSIKCTENELLQCLRHSSTESFRCLLKKIAAKDYLDAMVLHTLGDSTLELQLCPEKEDDLITIKWAAFDGGIGSSKRDACILDHIGRQTTKDNLEVMSWCITAIDGCKAGCMSMKESHGLSRVDYVRFGFFWRNINDEVEIVACGSVPSKHSKFIMQRIYSAITKMQDIVEGLRIGNQEFVHRDSWVKDDLRKGCHLCMRNFHTLRRKHHCRMCGEVICSDCSIVRQVELPIVGTSKLRLCKGCLTLCKEPTSKTPHRRVATPTNRGTPLNRGTPSSRSSDDKSRTPTPTTTSRFLCLSEISDDEDNNEEETPQWRTTELYNRKKEEYPRPNKPLTDSSDNRDMFGLLCDLACQTLDCPMASVGMLDHDEGWFLSSCGVEDEDTKKELSLYTGYALSDKPLVVLDSQTDSRIATLLSGLNSQKIRFFAGAPILGKDGERVGFICVADQLHRDSLGSDSLFTMEKLATLAVTAMEERKLNRVRPNKSLLNSNRQTSFNSDMGFRQKGSYRRESESRSSSVEETMRGLLLKSYETQQQCYEHRINV